MVRSIPSAVAQHSIIAETIRRDSLPSWNVSNRHLPYCLLDALIIDQQGGISMFLDGQGLTAHCMTTPNQIGN